MLGKPYILDHCVNHLKKSSEETALKVYITDALKAVAENTGRFVKGGMTMRRRFADVINNVPEESKEDSQKRADDIIARMKNKLAKLGKGDAPNECADTIRSTDA